MSWEKVETKYGFSSKVNIDDLFNELMSKKITILELQEMNNAEILSGEDLSKIFIKVSDNSIFRDFI